MSKEGGQRDMAEAVRSACVEAALRGYEEAGVAGLCHEGAWEMAVDAMRALDLASIVEQHERKRE